MQIVIVRSNKFDVLIKCMKLKTMSLLKQHMLNVELVMIVIPTQILNSIFFDFRTRQQCTFI